MPFTLAHPAAVLLLRRLGLSTTALVAGAMVPDLPLFVDRVPSYAETHSWLGVLLIDPALTLVAVGVWFLLVRDALVDLAPSALRSRVDPHARLTRRAWLLVPVAGAVGALTHVVWDAFTHRGRWGVELTPGLSATHAGLPDYRWAQYLSGVVGCTLVVLASVSYLRRCPVRTRPRRAPRSLAWLAATGFGLALLLAPVVALPRAGAGYRAMAYHGTVASMSALLAVVALACVLWQVAALRPRR